MKIEKFMANYDARPAAAFTAGIEEVHATPSLRRARQP